jgi:hypothetical protein
MGWRSAGIYFFSRGEMSVWLPIETAPRDGTEILVCTVHGHRRVMRWVPWPNGKGGSFRAPAGSSWLSPKYWMPLEPAPKRFQ